MHSALHTHETKTTNLHLFFSANVDAVNVQNAFVLASSMWFTAKFQILVVVALFKFPELGVHWFSLMSATILKSFWSSGRFNFSTRTFTFARFSGTLSTQNPLACMAPKTPKLKQCSSLPKGWSPITPDASHDPLDLGFLASPSYISWDAEYSEVLRNASFVLK